MDLGVQAKVWISGYRVCQPVRATNLAGEPTRRATSLLRTSAGHTAFAFHSPPLCRPLSPYHVDQRENSFHQRYAALP